MSALMIARITVRDPEKLEDYMAKTMPIAASYGAELLFRGKVDRALNGDDDHSLAVVARFPSREKIDEWFASEAYQPLVSLRENAADMQMTSYVVLD